MNRYLIDLATPVIKRFPAKVESFWNPFFVTGIFKYGSVQEKIWLTTSLTEANIISRHGKAWHGRKYNKKYTKGLVKCKINNF